MLFANFIVASRKLEVNVCPEKSRSARSVDAAESHPSRPAEAAEQQEPRIYYPVESATLTGKHYNLTDFRRINSLQTRQDPSTKAENWGAQYQVPNARTGAPVIARPLAGGQAPRPGTPGRSEDPADPCTQSTEAAQFRRLLLAFSHCSRTLSNCIQIKRIEKGNTFDFGASCYVFSLAKITILR